MTIFEYILSYFGIVIVVSLLFRHWLLPIWLERFQNENRTADKAVALPLNVLKELVFWLNTLFFPLVLIETFIYIIRKRRQ